MKLDLQSKSPILEEVKDPSGEGDPGTPDYSDDESLYIRGLQVRLEKARDQRDQPHEEFDGMTYLEWYDMNEKMANTYIPPKKNKTDTTFVSGTIRQKLFALLAHINNLDLSPDISAYDSNNFSVQSLGDAMEDIFAKLDEDNGEDEKKMLRQYELLKQGTVFIQDTWEEKYYFDKPTKGIFNGFLNSIKWHKIRKLFSSKPDRTIIPGVNVYLGSITTYGDTDNQPYLFTVEYIPYSEAETMWGGWERWKYVTKTVRSIANNGGTAARMQGGSAGTTSSMLTNNWRLLDPRRNMVEVIKYQSKPDYEFALILNGVLMTPVGMPFPWKFYEYSIKQQNLEPFSSSFSYGKSFCSRLRTGVEILDEMLRMAVLKTQKSFAPPYLNLTGRVVSSSVFMPFAVTQGIGANQIRPVSDKEAEGVTNSEFNMITELQRNLDNQSVSPTFAGQQATGNPTATQILETQRQAKLVLGITIFSISLLEWKLSWLRLYYILSKWFDPIDQTVDQARNELRNKYRNVNMKRPISGEGMGTRMTIMSEEQFTPETIKQAEDQMTQQQGNPVRIIVLNPKEIKEAKYTWMITIKAREKKSSELAKIMFNGMLQDLQFFAGTVNIGELQDEFASVWEKNPNKLFNRQAQQGVQAAGIQMPGGQPMQGVQPAKQGINLPTAESTLNQSLKNTLGQQS